MLFVRYLKHKYINGLILKKENLFDKTVKNKAMLITDKIEFQ